MPQRTKIAWVILLVAALGSCYALVLMGPVIQDEGYHHFADTHRYLGIPNFWNVITNLPFVVVGLLGFSKLHLISESRILHALFYSGITLIAFGSAYYHWNPTTDTLFWDRLPMTITFMSLFAIMISDFLSVRAGKVLILPLLVVGVLSVLVWRFGEAHDLRLYAWVQFFPLLAMPAILLLLKSRLGSGRAYWMLFALYAVAKVLEHFDKEVYHTLGWIGGHPLKHLLAGAGLYILVRSFTTGRARSGSRI